MSFLTTLGHMLLPPLQERSDLLIGPPDEFPDFETQLSRIRARRDSNRPWRLASVTEALGVPSILGAVSLISNTVGSLSLEAFRQGNLLTDRAEVPRLIIRPNPFTTPRVFFRDTAFHLATRGEAWWWVAARDERDGTPLSLYPVPPWEVIVEENERNRLKPTIKWNDKEIPSEDMRHLTYLPGADGRGVGPLQLAGAAVSVSVEAEHWAANFFSGSMPSIIGTTEQEMTSEELEALDRQWNEKPSGQPRWLTQGLTLSEPPYNPEKAQLNESRQHEVGNTARMYNMPGALIEYQMSGSSLRYQNDETIWADFQRRCLSPNYLEPIEQEISDLLTRSTVGRFNLDQLLRASIKTRAEVYAKFAEVLGPEETAIYMRKKEGMAPGNADFQPVPMSQPQAIPSRLAFQQRSAAEVRCESCNRLLADSATPPYRMTCPRCKSVTEDLQERTLHEPQPVINVHPAPVTVEAPQITFERGAFEAPDMSGLGEAIAGLANRPAPNVQVDVAAPDMTGVAEAMNALADRPQPDITVNTPEVHVEPPNVTFAEGSITSPITVEPAQVTVNVPEQTAPQVVVNMPEQKPVTRNVERDAAGRIARVIEQ